MIRLPNRRKALRAFTLIELLVVVSIIALLVSILLPALQEARKQAKGVICSTRMRSLGMAWVLYADDNNGRIIFAATQEWTVNGVLCKPWVYGITKRGCTMGVIYPYVETVDVFRCPLDKSYKGTQWGPGSAFRTYSILDPLNGHYNGTMSDGLDESRRVRKIARIKRVSEQAVFVEEGDKNENGSGISNGSWIMNPTAGHWIDALATRHGRKNAGACFMSYGDGHVDKVNLDANTTEIMNADSNPAYYPVDIDSVTFKYVRRMYNPKK